MRAIKLLNPHNMVKISNKVKKDMQVICRLLNENPTQIFAVKDISEITGMSVYKVRHALFMLEKHQRIKKYEDKKGARKYLRFSV
ncbi:hypothetical protein ZQ65_27995 [Salmonella enterica subsp. enterica serovar Newport]|uniref:ArsR family transcriptional regulator n=6 Tax=Salmonella enterica TaxID=28901 RepID=A0A742RLP6_SALER|nr:hypothetical protein LFZ16_03485 [Salmonella enterica subsp. enterica serovar India str. SA20085604]EAS1838135.1 hypothetical protein [Salmonella enterica]EBS4088831.1 hypothetical protein [Salmonella enterica subsp. enterica serovar Newport]EBV1274894.1 hypothetical protein [Salmonella enterica subsp. enterica serovar Oranienburg]EBW8395106.1 hypothetical protein [Salmonella enterica subsp. enterica serovar Florida]ECA2558413.1 hypothetical protein [Salmonella enterica subsp. enterica sero